MSREKKRIAVYCRVARENEDAMACQMQRLLRFAVERGYSEIHAYQDNGVTGSSLSRPAFNLLNADILSGKIQAVAVTDLSRISRNFLLTQRWLDMTHALGMEVFSISDGLGNLHDAEWMQAVACELFKLIERMEARTE